MYQSSEYVHQTKCESSNSLVLHMCGGEVWGRRCRQGRRRREEVSGDGWTVGYIYNSGGYISTPALCEDIITAFSFLLVRAVL